MSQKRVVWTGRYSKFNASRPIVSVSDAGIRDGKGALYPTMLDPSTNRRNFDRFGESGYIYWTEFACSNPKGACWERDVVRRPLRLTTAGDA